MAINRRKFLSGSGAVIAGSLLLPKIDLAAPAPAAEPFAALKNAGVKKILLRSAWAVTNIGDIGHTPGTLHILEQYLPDAEVTLWPVAFNEEVEAMIRKRFPKVKILKGPFTQGDGRPLNPEIMQAFQDTDFFLYNSGMHFNYGLFNYEWNGLVGMMSLYYVCQQMGKPYGLYGHSFDLFAEPSRFVFAPVLNKAAFIYCRDGESLKYLKENNVHAPVMEFAPDGCFGIDTLNEETAKAYLNAHDLKENEFMALIIRSYTGKPGSNANTKDKLNPAQATPEQQELDKERFAKITSLVTTWVRQTKKKVLLAPEASKEIPSAKTLVMDAMPEDVKPYIVHRDTFWNADEALSVYKRASVVVGMEPHSLIMALAVGVPIIHTCPFTFGKKGWMFRDIGLPEWLFDIDKASADEMIKTLLVINGDLKAARTKVAKAMQFVHQRQKETMQVLKKSMA